MNPSLYLHDATNQRWLRFRTPHEIIRVQHIDGVLPALRRIEQRITRDRLYAAGFISYEAAPAFDPAYQVHPLDEFPLLWFGLYSSPRTVELPAPPAQPGYTLGGGSQWSPSVGWEEYDRAITYIKDRIANGKTYQVNYTMRLRAPFVGQPWGLFLELARSQPAYAAYIDTGRYVLCSASPELFFDWQDDRLACRPMKGTAARGRTLAEDQAQADWLYNSEKNRAENVMIVDMLRNDLGRIAQTGSVDVPRLFTVERYPTVWQMTSTVTAASQAGLPEIMQALFPCASITGAPKISTMRIIAQLEPTPRRIYTGCIGFITPQRRAQFNVAIRTVLIDRQSGQAEYGVGGGIVWDSTSAEEYEECQIKARLLTQPQPIFSLLESLLWTPEQGYFLLPYHLRRLADSAVYFNYPLDLGQVETSLAQAVAGLPAEPHKVRLLVNRQGAVACQAAALSVDPRPAEATLLLSPVPISSADPFLYHKTTHRQVYEAARSACRGECSDVLLWNEHRQVTESDAANLVARLDGRLVTPPVACGLLPGSMRAWLLEQGQVQEQVIGIDDLPRCAELFLINSVRKWRPARLLRSP